MTEATSAVPANAAGFRDRVRARAGRAELLLFRVAGEFFATELSASEEALELTDHPVHAVPGRVPSRLGVISVRGQLLPLYNPRLALGLAATDGDAAPTMAIVYGGSGGRVAVAVDEVEDVLSADFAELHEAPGANRGSLGVLLGALHHEGRLVGIVDAEALLGACRMEFIKTSVAAPNPASAREREAT